MTATVVVHAEPPLVALRRGCLGVEIDGVPVGKVKQGAIARFPVPAGTHTVRLTTWDRTRSNTVTVEAVEDREFLLTGRATGYGFAFLVVPLVRATMIPWPYAAVLLLLMVAVFWSVPGLLFRLRAVGDSLLPSARGAEPARPAEEGSADSGLWWESDPALAKRFGKNAAS
ncbi:hypothetical protein [Streptomyces sp. CBMA123]|uniref:hypothetical protein n=1 Tax=Streptomyces sp. CBMA123 TaxID=1896313 RepID=UPI0016620834|nr:hypothetical protein [Streptomyces sp. CBMA123]MBD0692944.1 hypothetical protein [Streptomyces sp. CBMA123]